MTDNTENLKSFGDSKGNNAQCQDSVINEHIKTQDQIIKACEKTIADNQVRLNIAINSKEFCTSQLSKKASTIVNNSEIPLAKAKNQRQIHRERLKTLSMEVFKDCSENNILATKGLMVGEITDLVIEKDKDIKLSPNTVGQIVKGLVDEGIVIPLNPDKNRGKHFKLKENEE